MKVKHALFSQVALARDLPEYNLKRGDIATIVEHYSMPEGEEDGYSLEGFNVPHVTIEVAASQIIPISQSQIYFFNEMLKNKTSRKIEFANPTTIALGVQYNS